MSHEQLPESVIRALSREGEGRLHTDPVTRAAYANDGSHYMIMPLGVWLPKSAEDVALAVRLAHEHEFPLIMRGAGSGLAGETLGRALIVDTTRFLDRIHRIDPDTRTVRVDAGVVLDTLNEALAPRRLKFGPDPSSSSRATVASVVANNSAGAHSLVYGHTRRHLKAVECVLSDGSQARFEARPLRDVPRGPEAARSLEESIYQQVVPLIQQNADLIEAKRPKTQRDRAGYLLYDVADEESVNLARLLCPSEGTLAAITALEMNVEPVPAADGFVVLYFPSFVAAAWAVRHCLEHAPAALEFLDETALKCIRMAGKGHLLPEEANAILFVEFYGESDAEVKDRIDKLVGEMRNDGDRRFGVTVPRDKAHAAEIWSVRKAVEPMAHRIGWQNGTTPAGFVEDAAVDPNRLGEYMEGLSRIMIEKEREWGMYGHAGAGLLHTRVYLDLSDPRDLDLMQEIGNEVMDFVLELGGTISGEHGTGLVRTQFVPRQYGELYPVLEKVKSIFDPKNILNPGKIVGNADPDLMKKNLRARPSAGANTLRPLFSWEAEQAGHAAGLETPDWLEAAAHCTGCGECRTPSRVGRMCPSFKDSPDELRTTRARANLMRMIARGELDAGALFSDMFDEPANYCLNCKMCKVFCPVAVDGGKLMTEARAQIAQRCGISLGARTMIASEGLSKLAGVAAPIANFVNSLGVTRWAMEKVTGIDRRRDLPEFGVGSFLGRHTHRVRPDDDYATVLPPDPDSCRRTVVYFVDQFANYNDRSVAEAFLNVMAANNVRVLLPRQMAASMPAFDFGDLDVARRAVEFNIASLAPLARRGLPIVCTEPTAALALKHEYGDLVPSRDQKLVADAVKEACEFLRELHREDGLNTDFRPLSHRLAYHTPCHLQSFEIGRPGLELMRLIPGVEATLIDKGCCGLAGAFGWTTDQYDLSKTIVESVAGPVRDARFSHGSTECSLCRMQLEAASNKAFLHPMKVLADAYGAPAS